MKLINPSTQVELRQLLNLQRYVSKLDLSRRLPTHAHMSGNRHSRFRGRGMDYQESRSYQPGDDIRNMDWRVTARAGKPHTKIYQEERERPIFLLVDLGPGMFFASQGTLKSVVAAKTATLLAWAAAAHGDRVGGLLLAGKHTELRPKTGKRGALQLIHALIKNSDPLSGISRDWNPLQLNMALERLQHSVRPGSMIFLISDFSDIDDSTADLLTRLHHHNDLAAIRIIDPLEKSPPPAGYYGVTDGKNTRILNTRKDASAYRDFFNQQDEQLTRIMHKCRVPLLSIATNDDVVHTLQSAYGMRRTKTAQLQNRGAA